MSMEEIKNGKFTTLEEFKKEVENLMKWTVRIPHRVR